MKHKGIPFIIMTSIPEFGEAYRGLKANLINFNDGDQKGLALGFYTQTGGQRYEYEEYENPTNKCIEGNFSGVSLAVIGNNICGESKGLLIGLLNWAEKAAGMQCGLVNVVEEYVDSGNFLIQTGAFNYSNKMLDDSLLIQIGAFNIISKYSAGPVLQIGAYNKIADQIIPGINFRYRKFHYE